jgi:hypothetical protein
MQQQEEVVTVAKQQEVGRGAGWHQGARGWHREEVGGQGIEGIGATPANQSLGD